jgi:hypothetical protein
MTTKLATLAPKSNLVNFGYIFNITLLVLSTEVVLPQAAP